MHRAAVEISSSGGIRIVSTDAQGQFNTEFSESGFTSHFIGPGDLNDFCLSLKITKKGYQVAHRYVVVKADEDSPGIAVTLRPIKTEATNGFSQDDLTQALAPRLRQIGPADGLPAKEAKDYAHAVQDFFDRNRAEQAVPRLIRLVMRNPSCLKCRTTLALAELNWADWDDAERDLEESAQALIADRKLARFEPIFAWGVVLSWRNDLEEATRYLQEAARYAPQDALVLEELGRVQCLNFDWYDANDTLQKALAAGAGPEARLMRVEALLWAGTPEDAESELKLYLHGRDPRTMSPRVRAVRAKLQEKQKDQAMLHAAEAQAAERGEPPLDLLHRPPQNLPGLEPATDQAPLPAILSTVGKNISNLFASFPNICSQETIHQERLGRKGEAWAQQEYKYRYLLLTSGERWGLSIDEYRANLRGEDTGLLGLTEDAMLTSGFISAPLIFHPVFQSGSTFRLLGRQRVNGRNTFVILYAQDPAKSRLYGSFRQGENVRVTYTQGIAWVDAETDQIIRLTSDLLSPLPQIRLKKETTDIEFSEVALKRLPQKFWLPVAVTVTVDWHGKVLRNRHLYSDFLIADVNSKQKIAGPKTAERTVEEGSAPTPQSTNLQYHSISLVPTADKP